MGTEYRLDELARQAEVASTTVRLYQSKGLLAPPRLEGRTGWYDDSHLSRLRLIARLQNEGHSLAGIADLLEQWENGRSLDAVIGIEAELDSLLGEVHAIVLDPADLLARFPEGSMTPELMQRAAALGLVEPTEDGRVRVADRRFLDSGSALADLGIPADVILDEWDALVAHTDDIAERFITIFETHLAPEGLAGRTRHRQSTRAGDHARSTAGHRSPGPPRRARCQRRPPRSRTPRGADRPMKATRTTRRRRPIYVESRMRVPMEQLWDATQDPEQHQRWDVRFGSITYLPKVDGEPQRFTYATTVAPGVTVAGTGESLGDRDRPDGTRWSGLKFWTNDRRSILRAGTDASDAAWVDVDDACSGLTRVRPRRHPARRRRACSIQARVHDPRHDAGGTGLHPR